MMLSVLSFATVSAEETVSYSVAVGSDGKPLNVKVINNVKWVEEDGKLKMPKGPENSFLLFDNKLKTNRVESTFVINDNTNGDGNHRNGIVFALTDHDGDSTFASYSGTDVSYYWAYIGDWSNLCVFKMAANQGQENCWSMIGKDVALDAEALKTGVKIAVEWDDKGHIKVYADGKLTHDITDSGTPLNGNLYGLLVNKWGNTQPADYQYPYNAHNTSFTADTVVATPDTGDATVAISIVAVVAAIGTGIVIGKKRIFN